MVPTAAVDQRLVRNLAGTLRLTPTDQEGATLEVVGPVTVSIVDQAGATVRPATAAIDGGTSWTSPIPPAYTAVLARWTCTWVDADTGSSWTTYVEVAGAHLYTAAELKASDPTVADETDTKIAETRLVVEAEAEWICDVAFTPRLAVVTVDGTDTDLVGLGVNACRRLVALSIDGVSTSTTGLVLEDDGQLWRPAGWSLGRRSVVAIIEHGLDRPPADLHDALLVRARTLALRPDSNVPLTAVQWQPEAGGTYRLDRASRYRTGIADVDAVYFRHSRRSGDGSDDQPAPTSRTFDFDPSFGSIFHQGRR